MIVVDASVAAKWLFPEAYSDQALRLLADMLEAGEHMAAPPLLMIEVGNILRQRMRRASVGLSDALDLLRDFEDIPVAISLPPGGPPSPWSRVRRALSCARPSPCL